MQSRRLPVLGVLAVSQPAGLLLIAVLIPVMGADPIPVDKLAIAFLAGVASLGGLGAFYAAMAGVVILSYEEDPEHAGMARRSIALAILAGLGFGIFFTGLDAAAADRPGWAILAVRVGGVSTVIAALLVARPP